MFAGQPLGGPLTTYVWIGYALGLLFAGMYVAVNLAVIGFYRGERRAEFNPIKHLVIPILGVILLIPAFLGVLGGLTIPILDIDLDPLAAAIRHRPAARADLDDPRRRRLLRRSEPDAGCPDPRRRCHDGGLTGPQSKIDSGQCAVTMKFGTSTISLIRRSTATLHSR